MKYLTVLAVLIFMTSCSESNKPELKKLENFQVKELNIKEIKIQADAQYYNPNPVGINIDSWDIVVTANEVKVGNVILDIPSNIPPNGNFTIPIVIEFPPADILNLDSGILIGLLSGIKDKKVDLHYKGHVTMDVLGVKFDIPIDEKEVLKLKK